MFVICKGIGSNIKALGSVHLRLIGLVMTVQSIIWLIIDIVIFIILKEEKDRLAPI